MTGAFDYGVVLPCRPYGVKGEPFLVVEFDRRPAAFFHQRVHVGFLPAFLWRAVGQLDACLLMQADAVVDVGESFRLVPQRDVDGRDLRLRIRDIADGFKL